LSTKQNRLVWKPVVMVIIMQGRNSAVVALT
jgi:hypothetical protein